MGGAPGCNRGKRGGRPSSPRDFLEKVQPVFEQLKIVAGDHIVAGDQKNKIHQFVGRVDVYKPSSPTTDLTILIRVPYFSKMMVVRVAGFGGWSRG